MGTSETVSVILLPVGHATAMEAVVIIGGDALVLGVVLPLCAQTGKRYAQDAQEGEVSASHGR